MKHEPFNFDRLNSLKDGWLGEGSFAPTAVGLQWLTHVLEMYPDDMAPPLIAPDGDGNMVLEWNCADRKVVILTATLENHIGDWILFTLNQDDMEEGVINMDEPDSVMDLFNKVKDLRPLELEEIAAQYPAPRM